MAPRSVFITGASSGIGFAVAEEFLRQGCTVVAAARRLERLRPLEAQGALVFQLDVSDPASVAAVAEQVLRELPPGGPDILINNAGVLARGAVTDMPVEQVGALFDVNVLGALRVLRAFLPAMVKRRSGTVINVGSVAGFAFTPFTGAYCGSKAALRAFTDAMRNELAPFGIRVVLAAPGFVATDIFEAGVEADRVVVDHQGPYAPAAAEIETTIMKFGGAPLRPFARRFARMALSRRPPALYLDGRLSWVAYFGSLLLPTFLFDLICFWMFNLWRLAPWSQRLKAAQA